MSCRKTADSVAEAYAAVGVKVRFILDDVDPADLLGGTSAGPGATFDWYAIPSAFTVHERNAGAIADADIKIKFAHPAENDTPADIYAAILHPEDVTTLRVQRGLRRCDRLPLRLRPGVEEDQDARGAHVAPRDAGRMSGATYRPHPVDLSPGREIAKMRALGSLHRDRARRSWYRNRGERCPDFIQRGIRLWKRRALELGATRGQLCRPFMDVVDLGAIYP
jgi:hypothetical protein